MPTCVVSSSDTTGTLNAFGSRARQLDLFWSSNVYNTLTINISWLDAELHQESTCLPRIDRRGISLIPPSSADGAGVCCIASLAAVLVGVAMAAHELKVRTGAS